MGISCDSAQSKFKVVPIHRYPEFIKDTIELINSEWPRSIGARMWSLESSKDDLPCCLVLTSSPSSLNSDNNDNCKNIKEKKVLAHLKLTPIPSKIDYACFIESVVVWKSLRGQGIGSHIMLKAEEYCKYTLKMREIYLSTTDKEDFYMKLGYVSCPPVSIFGGACNGIFNPVTKKKYMKKILVEPSSSDDEK